MKENKLYDNYSAKYMEGNDRLSTYHRYRIQTFASLLGDNFELSGIRAIDYGCGDGVICQFFNEGAYVGIDPSNEMIRLANEKYNAYSFFSGGLEKLEENLSTNNFEILVCLNTLPYMSEEEQTKFFSLAAQYHVSIIASHTNELLDLNSFNRYTIEQRKSLLGTSEKFQDLIAQFKGFLTFPDLPPPVPQTEVRFGETTLNTSERDTVTKFRVDPFTWPQTIATKFGFNVKTIQPIRIFALPPGVMESDDEAFKLLHSDYFNFLPITYRLILCSQFRVVFIPNK